MTENYMTKGLPVRQVFCFAGPGTQGSCGYNSRKPALTASEIILYAPVISPLSFSAEIACGKLTHAPVIMKAIAAHSLAAARVGAVAYLLVIFYLTFHYWKNLIQSIIRQAGNIQKIIPSAKKRKK